MIMTAGAGLPTVASSERLQHLKGREPRAKTESRGNMNTIPPLTVSAAATCIRDQFTAENMRFVPWSIAARRVGLGWVLRLRSGSWVQPHRCSDDCSLLHSDRAYFPSNTSGSAGNPCRRRAQLKFKCLIPSNTEYMVGWDYKARQKFSNSGTRTAAAGCLFLFFCSRQQQQQPGVSPPLHGPTRRTTPANPIQTSVPGAPTTYTYILYMWPAAVCVCLVAAAA